MTARRVVRTAGVAGLVLVLGCGPSEPGMKPVFSVHGAVFVNGKPAKGAVVMFHPLPVTAGRFDMVRSRGTVGDDGTFQLSTYETADGAPEGEYAVTVYWPGKRAGKPAADDEGTDLPPDQLGLRFNDPAKTPLKATVKAPETRLEPFQLR
jgi:hypothetical protein